MRTQYVSHFLQGFCFGTGYETLTLVDLLQTEYSTWWLMFCFPPTNLHPTIWLSFGRENRLQVFLSLKWQQIFNQVCLWKNKKPTLFQWWIRNLTKTLAPIAGDPVMVVGFGGIGRHCGPSWTCGVLSKAIRLKDEPVMLQTTCAVQAGTSGGAVVHRLTGKLLGKREKPNTWIRFHQ